MPESKRTKKKSRRDRKGVDARSHHGGTTGARSAQEELDGAAATVVRELVIGAMISCSARTSSVDEAVNKLSRPLHLDNAKPVARISSLARRPNQWGWRKVADATNEKNSKLVRRLWRTTIPDSPTWGWVAANNSTWRLYAASVVAGCFDGAVATQMST